MQCRKKCPTGCWELYSLFTSVSDSNNEPELWGKTEVCTSSIWPYISVLLNLNMDCDEGFSYFDINNDGNVSFYETILYVTYVYCIGHEIFCVNFFLVYIYRIAHEAFGLSYEKAVQIDCSKCLNNPALYH